MPFALALASAAFYGAADFLGGLASKRASTFAVVVVSQLAGLVLLAILMPLLPGAAPVRADITWGAIAGLAGGTGVALLYHALAVGTMAVVAPTTAVCAVAVPVLASIALGERPSLASSAGIVMAIIAIVLISQQTASAEDDPPFRGGGGLAPGVRIAFLAGLAIGVFFLALARTSADAGLWPLVAARGVSVALFVCAAVASARPLHLAQGTWAMTLLCGALDMGANALYMLAARSGPLSVVVTLSSLYPASTVLLARLTLGERLNRRQAAGVVCALVAVAMIVANA